MEGEVLARYLEAVRELYLEYRRAHSAALHGRSRKSWTEGVHEASRIVGECEAYQRLVPWLQTPSLWCFPPDVAAAAREDALADFLAGIV